MSLPTHAAIALSILLTAGAWARPSRADAPDSGPAIVVRYTAPQECPTAEAFATSVRTALVGRRVSRAHPVEVVLEISRTEGGYSARATSARDTEPLERTVQASTCEEVADIAAAIVALAQVDPDPDVVVIPVTPTQAAAGSPVPAPPQPSPVSDVVASASPFSFDVALGFAAFTAGPSSSTVWADSRVTVLNRALGARLGLDVAHSLGWWKQSLHLNVAYLRQGTTTRLVPTEVSVANAGTVADRDVFQATVDACPVHLEYAFLSAEPCMTFTALETQGQSGAGDLETGLGFSGYVRAHYSRFFVEAYGAGVANLTAYEAPSINPRFFYAFSIGATLR
jgi:hypothetical protein